MIVQYDSRVSNSVITSVIIFMMFVIHRVTPCAPSYLVDVLIEVPQ
jgi:hypothetical protein